MDTQDNQLQPTRPLQENVAQSQPVQPEKPNEPQNPVSGPHKELGPMMEAPVAEYVAPANPSEIEPVLTPEVKEVGVESAPNVETPQLTEEHKKVGITHAPEATPVTAAMSSQTVQWPYTYQQVEEKIKETTNEDSAHWLFKLHKLVLEKLGVRA